MVDHEQRLQFPQGDQGIAKWYGVAKSIGYELRPFPLPTKEDIRDAVQLVKTNEKQIVAEGARLWPEIWKMVKTLGHTKTLVVCGWLYGWVGFIWLEFGAVYFIVSVIVVIFTNLGEHGEGEWSAYSVFNAGCKALLGTINAAQFEREMMHQHPAGPLAQQQERVPHPEPAEDGEYVFVDHHNEADNAFEAHENGEYGEEKGEVGGSDRAAPPPPKAGGGAGTGTRRRKVSGKRARRSFAERRERQEERRLALQALGHGDWD